MAMLYLLDTNICIYLMKRQPPQVLARFATLAYGDVAMSALTLAELRFGARVSASRAQNGRMERAERVGESRWVLGARRSCC